jgi:hypothetical protein
MSGGWTSTLTQWIFGKFLPPLLSRLCALGYNNNRAIQSMDVYVAMWLSETELVLQAGQLQLVLKMHIPVLIRCKFKRLNYFFHWSSMG